MIVFVHGVPETAAIWKQVRLAIDGESVALQLPGFGCPIPQGFGATMEEYSTWLAAQLRDIDGPIDLVGHDWGAGFTLRVVTTEPDLVRSWVIDIGNMVHPDYEWHDIAKMWQTPGVGEQSFEDQYAMSTEDRAALLESLGVPHHGAMEMAAALDPTMGSSILALYRSATPNPMAHWGPVEPPATPGLVLCATGDAFGDPAKAAESASNLGARFATVDGVGHFWPYEAPERVVPVLQSFWADVR